MNEERYVWYASYGSNLSIARFLYRLEGGRPPGSANEEKGCRDETPPKDNKPICIHFPLYFAKYSQKWCGGVAFIGLDKDAENTTYGRRYLITQEQFTDVFKQENRRSNIPNDFEIDFEEVKKRVSRAFCKSWYGNVVYLNESQGLPIFTFTAYWNIRATPFTAPSEKYLKHLISGLKETYPFTDENLVKYLIEKPGIKGNFTEDKLKHLCQKASCISFNSQ